MVSTADTTFAAQGNVIFALKQLDPIYFPLAKKFYKTHGQSNKTDRQDEVFAAYTKDHICACLRIGRLAHYPLMRAVYVAPEHRRQGLARALIRYSLEHTKKQECWTFPYQDLVTFYQQFGYSEVSSQSAPAAIQEAFKNYTKQGRNISLMQWKK